jgi:hypothetical protein
MSDRLPSALRELADLDTERLGVLPEPAAGVRARGDRRRRRRHAASAVAAAAAVAVVGIGATLVSHGPSEQSPAPEPAPTTVTDEPTAAPSDEPSTDGPTPDPTTAATELRIPDDFPLNASYPTTNEDTTPVKVSGEPGFGGLTLCGETILVSAGAADVLGTKFVGAEDYRSRTLLLFEKPADALAVLQQAELAVQACPAFDNSSLTPFEVQLGDESFGFDQTFEDTGGDTRALSSYLVVQVGRAVLIGTAYGESGFPNTAFHDGVVDQARGVVQAMGALLP